MASILLVCLSHPLTCKEEVKFFKFPFLSVGLERLNPKLYSSCGHQCFFCFRICMQVKATRSVNEGKTGFYFVTRRNFLAMYCYVSDTWLSLDFFVVVDSIDSGKLPCKLSRQWLFSLKKSLKSAHKCIWEFNQYKITLSRIWQIYHAFCAEKFYN